MFWKRKCIEVYSRQAFFSSISQHKKRLAGFSHELCYQNLLATFDSKLANLTFFFDAARGPISKHFLRHEKNVIQIEEGTEAGSFLRLLEHVSRLSLDLDTILYFVEDDYLHRPGWGDVLLDGFQIPGVEYVTLYDHKDKYFLYPDLTSRVFASSRCHWRTIPSTTNTFAVRVKTLQRDLQVHYSYSEKRSISADHEKFSRLTSQGSMLISPIPGWSTHSEPEFASPFIDWELYFEAARKRSKKE